FVCGNLKASFSFWGNGRSSDCGVPGMELRCQDGNNATIEINDVRYRVLDINEGTQILRIAREDNLDGICKPDFVNSTFDPNLFQVPKSWEYITLVYGCAPTISVGLGAFTCAISGNLSGRVLPGAVGPGPCYRSIYLPVNGSEMEIVLSSTRFLLVELRQGFEVNWKVDGTTCSECIRSGGACGYDLTSNQTTCYCPNGSNTCISALPISLAVVTVVTVIVIYVIKKARLSRWKALLWWKDGEGNQKIEAFMLNCRSLAPKRYSYSDIKKMTNSFKCKLGQGGFGTVYKGTLPGGHLVAVKVLNKLKSDGEEFTNEVASISRTSHFMCGKTSAQANSSHLEWRILYEIAIGIARGLEYLHRGCNTRILHFDIKPQNILLDEDFCPKISDFGLAKLCKRKESKVSMAEARGTIGYIAPEVFHRHFGGVSFKSDVYSYGMILLEMVGDRKGIDVRPTETSSEMYFPDWFYKHLESDVLVSALHGGLAEEEEEMVRKLILVGLWCIQTDPSFRPSMTKVIEMLEGGVQSLELPPKPSFSSPTRLSQGQSAFLSPSTFTGSQQLVISINLPLRRLNGTLPPKLSNLTELKSLSIPGNLLYGHLPMLSNLSKLELLDLSNNGLTGRLPPSMENSTIAILHLNGQETGLIGTLDVLASMTELYEVWLDENNFTGPIPDFSNCNNLFVLVLRDNQLTGVVPESLVLHRTLRKVLLSNNKLQGPTPVFPSSVDTDVNTGTNHFCAEAGVPCDEQVNTLVRIAGALGYPEMLSDKWRGNDACGWDFITCNRRKKVIVVDLSWQRLFGTVSPHFANLTYLVRLQVNDNHLTGPIPDSLTKLNNIQVLDVSGISVTIVMILVIAICFYRREGCDGTPTILCRKDTLHNERIESFIANAHYLTPKRYSYADIKKMTNSFADKVGQGGFGCVYKGKLPDGRLVAVKLLTISKGDGEFIRVHDSSHANHHLKPKILFEIAIGIARGLEYLHRGCNTRIVHFDIKPHNILLDEVFCPKISDFGLAKLCKREESKVSMIKARGTIGYVAPEVFCINFGGVSYKSDVYSYGMMVLEMVAGRKPDNVGSHGSEIYFSDWIYKHLEVGVLAKLHGVMAEEEAEKVQKMILVGLWCIQTNPHDRPSMTKVIEMLETDDGAVLLKLANSVNHLPIGWSTTSSAGFCDWYGVECDPSLQRVISINLPVLRLNGTLPPELSNLTELKSLSLPGNWLYGHLPLLSNLSKLEVLEVGVNGFTYIPPGFFRGLVSLKTLSLGSNPFSPWELPLDLAELTNLTSFAAINANIVGSIPDIFGSLPNLQNLELSYNGLTGQLPPSMGSSKIVTLHLSGQETGLIGTLDVLASMTELYEVWLDENNFTGPIPDFSNCTDLFDLVLTDNKLTGVVPESLVLHRSLRRVQLSNNKLQGPTPVFPSSMETDVNTLVRIAGALGYPEILSDKWQGISVSIVMILVIAICFHRREGCDGSPTILCRKDTIHNERIESFITNAHYLTPKRYSYADIKKMTNSFADKVGQGGFGCVYKGKLPDGCFVAVKLLTVSKGDGEVFINEVASICRTSHVNIVTLLGFCYERTKRALIYEYMPNGSLDKFICVHESPHANHHLKPKILFEIAIGIARGLEYLHRGCNTRIVHFDIKPHNILLDEVFCPKISDFGLAKLCKREESKVSMIKARGTIGYVAPEVFCRNFGGVSYKSDVYSYGMMVLEMVAGRKTDNIGSHGSEIYFSDWIYKHLEVGVLARLHGVMTEEEAEKVQKMILVGLWCIQTNPHDRPSMTKVIEMLESNLQVLQIPPKPFLASPAKSPKGYFTDKSSSPSDWSQSNSITPLPPGWSNTTSTGLCTNWHGVDCNSFGRVAYIDLSNRGLTGTLPFELSNLTQLVLLSLASNNISGDLSPLANLSNLETLELDYNKFTYIPYSFFQGLIGLKYFSISHNPSLASWSLPVTLAERGHLSSFTADYANLIGPIPEIFDSLPYLKTLWVGSNSLEGPLPKSLANSVIQDLGLNDQGKGLSGAIDVIASMTLLTKVWLAGNKFTGPIPDLSDCKDISDLQLQFNQLTGVVPASLVSLPKLLYVSLANNKLQGPAPVYPSNVQMRNDSANNFCAEDGVPCDVQVTTMLQVAGALGYPVLLSDNWLGNDACNWTFIACDTQQRQIITVNLSGQHLAGTISPEFANLTYLKNLYLNDNNLTGKIPDGLTSLKQLENFDFSNNNLSGKVPGFSIAVKLTARPGNLLLQIHAPSRSTSGGDGGCGSVYKGHLIDGRVVAVKVLKKSKGDGQEFINEVESISRTSHVNIVALLGFCYERNRRALMYEYMSNGSLDKFIYDRGSLHPSRLLEWKTLYEISVGIARGLEYLHIGCNTRIVHFDIKPHNILLDEDFCPKISDFGLAKLCKRQESKVSMIGARGTAGYVAPEVVCRNIGGVSYKSDVYSYGMMILEMVGGRKNVEEGASNTSKIFFPDWIHKHLTKSGEVCELYGIALDEEEQMVRKMTLVGLWCIQTNPLDRPSMTKVVEMLE
ncbi:hypothetical protein Tsubulata_008921, partial [Turnera subulata]